MFPQRKLLYHRGVDDNVGTYVTDYVYSAMCCVLCIQLIIRIRQERRYTTQENAKTSACHDILPWNWPKRHATPVAMSTYAVLLLGFSNFAMALFGGLTHQYLQTVEPYTGKVEEVRGWLIVWRTAAAFSACLCFSLLILTEQLVVQEVFRIPRAVRKAYYIISVCACLVFYAYNFVPLSANSEDPFSIRQSFIVSFALMFLYGFVVIAVLIRYCCCRSRSGTQHSSDDDVQYSPAHSTDSKRTERAPYSKEIYSCCKTVVVHWTNNADDVTSRKWELFLTLLAPWIFLAAGVANHFLKDKCADSDNAFEDLGCPLPNVFNHNALMHEIQIFSVIAFFLAENISITRRRNRKRKIRRTPTSSTLYNDINSCVVTIPETTVLESTENFTQTQCTNNNKPCNRDDLLTCETASAKEAQSGSDVASTSSGLEELQPEPMFPTSLDFGESVHRNSLYDNLSQP